jgi:hypothetical protein
MGGWLDNTWSAIKGAPGQVADLFQGAGEGAGAIYDWMGERSGQPTSNIPDADRSNFNTPGGQARADELNAYARMYGGRNAPQAADSSFRGYQTDLAERLARQASGADSMSQLALRGATDANIAQQQSLAAGARPGNQAMAQRLAMQNIGRMNQGFGSQAAQLGIQERNAAANALSQLAQGARGQDLGLNTFNANAQLQQTGLNDTAANNARQLELGNAALRQQGAMGYEANQTTRRGQDLGTPQGPANWERVVGAAGAVAPFFLADGGIVTRPTNAVVGEEGPEAIIPLDELLGGLKNPMEDHSNRDYAIKMSQESKDPVVRGLGAIANAWVARQKRGKEQAGMQGQLADRLSARPESARYRDSRGMERLRLAPSQLEGQGGGMFGASLANRADDLGYTMMAEGGVVTKPTRAVIGEEGPEAVIPLPYLPQLIKKLSDASELQKYDKAIREHKGWQGLIKPGTYSEPNARPFDPPDNTINITPEEAGILPNGRVEVVSHGRDYDAEFPFFQQASAQSAMEDAKREAKMTRPNWAWLTR